MDHSTITPLNESLAVKEAIRNMKRGSGRGANRTTPVDTRRWVPEHIIIAFPGYTALPAAASN